MTDSQPISSFWRVVFAVMFLFALAAIVYPFAILYREGSPLSVLSDALIISGLAVALTGIIISAIASRRPASRIPFACLLLCVAGIFSFFLTSRGISAHRKIVPSTPILHDTHSR